MLEEAEYSPESVSVGARGCDCKPVAVPDSDQNEQLPSSRVDQTGRDSALWDKEANKGQKRQWKRWQRDRWQ